jgi:hypothetical protein
LKNKILFKAKTMTPDELLAILIDNISFQLRHANYDRAIEVKKNAKMISASIGWEDEITRYRRFEEDTLKAQRIRLHNPPTKSALAAPRRYFKRMPRVEGIRKTFKASSDEALVKLQDQFYNFMPGESLDQWQNRILEFYGVNDPNAWIIAERRDKRNQEGTIINTIVYPFIVGCEDVLNFKRTFGELEWVLVRTSEMQRIATPKSRIDQIIENFYLYAPGYIAQAREVGEKTIKEAGDVEMMIEIYPSDAKPKAQKSNSPLAQIEYIGQPKAKLFYVRVKTNGTKEVPAECVGVYDDESTGGMGCKVPWFDPAMDDFRDLMRYKSIADVLLTTHAYPQTWEFTSACHDTHVEFGECDYGYYGGIHDTDHRCHKCNGTGIPANFSTEQAKVLLILPEDGQKEMIELAKLSHTQEIKIDLLEWLDGKIESTTAKIMNTLFGAGLFQKPTNSTTKTATEINELTAGISDVLAPFGALECRFFELFFRVGAQYQGFELEVDKSYPDDLKIDQLTDMVTTFDNIKKSGVGYEAIVAQRNRIFQKTFEGNPAIQKAIAARYKFKPWDDKNDEQVSMIVASRSATDPERVLWENWLKVFQEIEAKNPMFYEMTYEKQKQIVAEQVAEITALIQQPEVDSVPNFNSPINPVEETPANEDVNADA